MSVTLEGDFNPDTPESALKYVQDFTKRTGKKLNHVIVIYKDESGNMRVSGSKNEITQHLGLLEVGKNIIQKWGDGEDI